MAQKAVVDAVTARLGETWNGVAVVPPNTTDEPPADGSAFILLQFPVADVRRMPVGDRFYREEGGFRIVVHAERGRGIDELLTWTDDLAALFRDQSFDGVETQAPSTFVDDESEAGNYVRAAIAVPYTYNFAG